MNDLTIKNATEEQCKVLIQQANDRLAELAKPKQSYFQEGDFGVADGIYYPAFSKENGLTLYREWLDSFQLLAYHCLRLGGRVMSKPNDGETWFTPYYGFDTKNFDVEGWSAFTSAPFVFPSKGLMQQFLSTEGVQKHLMNFFQIER